MKMISPGLRGYLIGASGLVLSISLATAAQAQVLNGSDAAARPLAEVAEDAGEIIVTAQRRAENLQVVPVSVAVVSAQDLTSRGLTELRQITLAAPSLQVGHENNYSIRGVGTLAVQTTVDPAVAIALDEVNLGRTQLADNLFSDIAQVEVLSGPQGLLFGKNASAGLLNVTTRRPRLGVTEFQADAEFNLRDTTPGRGKGVILRATANLPVSSNSALRVSGLYSSQDPVTKSRSFKGRFQPTANNVHLRAKYLVEPAEGLNIYAIASYGKQSGTAGVFDRTWRDAAVGGLGLPALTADGLTAGPKLLTYNTSDDHFRNVKTYGGQVRIGYEFAAGFELVNIAAFNGFKSDYKIDQDFTSGEGVVENSDSTFRQFSNELRLVLPSNGRLTGQFGLFYLSLREKAYQQLGFQLFRAPAARIGFPFCVGATVQAGPPPACNRSNQYFLGFDNDYDLSNESFAGFGQLNFELSPGLKLLAGARLTHDKVDFEVLQNQGFYFTTISGPAGLFKDSVANTNLSYKVGVQYEPSPAFMFYASYATGYKAPGSNRQALVNGVRLIVNDETSKNIEVGARTSWLNGRLILNGTFFRTKYKDYQAQAFDPVAAGQTIRNAAGLTSTGFELNISARPITGLSINGYATVLDAKFDDFAGAPCYTGQPGCAANGTFNARGLRTPAAAKLTTSAEMTYEFPVGQDLSVSISGNWYHRSSFNFRISHNPKTRLGSTDLFGASLGLNVGERYRFSLFCKNCTDKRVPTFIYEYPLDALQRVNSTIQVFGFNSVRTIGLTAAAEF